VAVIRVRGVSEMPSEAENTLQMLHLTRNCHATLIDDRPSYLGMLERVQSYVTWGEVSKESIALLLKSRGRLLGDKKLSDEYAEKIGYKSLDDLAEAIHKLEAEYVCLSNVKPVFRLHPPRKGFRRKVKRSFAAGGVAGYCGEAINDLIKRMM